MNLGGLSGLAKREAYQQFIRYTEERSSIMAFGPRIQVEEGEVKILLRPVAKEESPAVAAGMQSREVTKYLATRFAFVIEDEHEWYEKMRTQTDSCMWGIEWLGDGEPQLIGITGLHNLNEHPHSGANIFRTEFWGRGIATAAHAARTQYAFEQLGLLEVRSAYIEGNEGSRKALERLGHVKVGTDYREKFVDGKWRAKHNLLMVNPNEPHWSYFWDGEKPPEVFQDARKMTRKVLSRAERVVTFV
jgi:RimJ/RimL family protein N-acetyltransferase